LAIFGQKELAVTGIAIRFKEYPSFYFTFIDNPDADRTNNVAERSVRPVAVERKVSYGTQGIRGNHCCEVFWSIRETLIRQGKDLNTFLLEAITASIEGNPLPSLVNPGQPVDQKYVEQAKQERKELKDKERNDAKAKAAKKKTAKPKVEATPEKENHEPQQTEMEPEAPPVKENPEPRPETSSSEEKLEAPPPKGKSQNPGLTSFQALKPSEKIR
jgi:outer membrane biosynthesis protein TonB